MNWELLKTIVWGIVIAKYTMDLAEILTNITEDFIKRMKEKRIKK